MMSENPDVLILLAEARAELSSPSDKLWQLVERIDQRVNGDPATTDAERALVTQLRSEVSDVFLAHREAHTSSGSAAVTLTALESSIRRRSTGADGWPLA